jgi:hypothetical protein
MGFIKITEKFGTCLIVLNLTIGLANATIRPFLDTEGQL